MIGVAAARPASRPTRPGRTNSAIRGTARVTTNHTVVTMLSTTIDPLYSGPSRTTP
jgi:hypothetical protein